LKNKGEKIMFTKLLKYSIKNILRNKFLSISSILVLTLLMFFINLLLVVHSTSFELINYVNNKMSISLYLKDEYDKNTKDVIDLKENLKKISPNSKIIYKSKDELLEEIRQQDIKLVQILEKQNPLPNTITISDIPISDYEKLNYAIEWKLYLFSWNDSDNLENKDEVFASYKSQYSRITSVIKILKTLWFWLYLIIAIFIFAIWIITYSIIWNFIYYYRDEIYITKLVWWSKAFIYWPFSLQWMIYSIIAFFISISVFYFFVEYWITSIFGTTYSLDFIFKNAWIIFPLELLLFSSSFIKAAKNHRWVRLK
jgi:cell division transport system permease protein